MSSMNQVVLVVIIKFLAISTDSFKGSFVSFFFWRSCDDMPGKFESLYCEVSQGHEYSTDGGEF